MFYNLKLNLKSCMWGTGKRVSGLHIQHKHSTVHSHYLKSYIHKNNLHVLKITHLFHVPSLSA